MGRTQPLAVIVASSLAVASALLVTEARTTRLAPPVTWHVRVGGAGNGSAERPFGHLADALAVALAGHEILVAPGTYTEPIRSLRGGTPSAPLVIRAEAASPRPVFTVVGRVATITHPHMVLDGLVLDGGYGNDDAVRVGSDANGLVLRNLEVRRTSRDCVDVASPVDVLIEQTLIHHCLNAEGGRKDAHGIVASAVERLTVRDSEIHTFSGDALQFDPTRAAPGWTDVRLERLQLWLGPLPSAANGFAAGTVPGENGVDTKTPPDGRRSRLVVSDVQAWGFRKGLVANMAAFNIKERVDTTFDRVTVRESEIAFRLRGPGDRGATTVIRDALVHHVGTAVRYEDDVASMLVERLTVGLAVPRPFRAVNASATRPDVRDILVLDAALPAEAQGHGRVVSRDAFVDVDKHDYRRRN